MIKATKREPGIGRGEPPLHGSPDFTTGFCPCVSLAAYARAIRQTPIQTLARQDGELDLCHVQPTAMLRRSVKRQRPCQPSGFRWWKSLVQHSWGMGVPVVQHHANPLCLREDCIRQPFHLAGDVLLRPPLRHVDFPPARQGVNDQQQVAASLPLICVP